MPCRRSDDITQALLRKGFREKASRKPDHYMYVYCVGDRMTSVTTKISHGSVHEICRGLLSTMARQCGLVTHEFCELVDCGLTADRYQALLVERQKVDLSRYG